eukprot:1451997-Amphidinium_carterae.1
MATQDLARPPRSLRVCLVTMFWVSGIGEVTAATLEKWTRLEEVATLSEQILRSWGLSLECVGIVLPGFSDQVALM